VNWLDVVLLIVLAFSFLAGMIKGLARAVIGLVAVIAGLLFGFWFYRQAGSYVPFIESRQIANIVGFFVIFIGIMLLGGLVARLLEKIFKAVHLSWLNRLLGGGFGLVRGIAISAVLIVVIMAFSLRSPPPSVANSRVAPYVIHGARAVAAAAPYEVREGFHKSYTKLREAWTGAVRKGARKLPADKL
jgi:membrane protein required for colicin V production